MLMMSLTFDDTHFAFQMLKHENIRRSTNAQTQVHRLEYEREVENKQKIKEAEKQADRVAFQSIDWHDFVVVETIEFKEGVVTTDMTATAEQGDEEEEEDSDVDMDMDEDDEDEDMEIEETKTILDDEEEEIEIRPSYKPKIQGTSMEGPKYFVNEKTGQKIAVDQSAEIMRIQNLDPKWREQQLRAQAKTKKTALASSADLARNLARMARHREDIFGETSSKSNESVSMDGTTVPPPPPRKDGSGDDGTVPPPPPKRTRYE